MIIPLNGIKLRQKEMSESVAPSQYPTHRLVNQYFGLILLVWYFTLSSLFYFSFIVILFHSLQFPQFVLHFCLSFANKTGTPEWVLPLFVIP
jgi:hypothetical protein